jgi:CheY-like chemotaxis protein
MSNSRSMLLAQIDKGLVFDLLFTDVIMSGGMNGRQLVDAVRARRPHLPRLRPLVIPSQL